MKKALGLFGTLLSFAAIAATPRAEAGVTHNLAISPGPHLVQVTIGNGVPIPGDGAAEYSAFRCITVDYHGSLRMAFNQGCGTATGSTWRRAYINLPWAPNPSSGESIQWSGNAPVNTKLAGRTVSYYADGTLASVSGFIYGGGWKFDGTGGNLGDGPIFMEVAMQSSVLNTTPELVVVGADVYAN